MTPAKLKESVMARFNPLMVDEDEQLDSMLRQTLTTYQDRAGVISRVRIEKADGASLKPPVDYLSLVHVTDSRGGLVYADPFPGSIDLDLTGAERYPFTMTYLVNLRDRNYDEWEIPADIIGMLEDYLEALIAIPNTDRLRRVSIGGKLDVSSYSDEQTLIQRKLDLEEKMSANRAIIPGATILP